MNVRDREVAPLPQTDASYVTSRTKGVDDYVPPATSSALPVFRMRDGQGGPGSVSTSPLGLEDQPIPPEEGPPATAAATVQFSMTTQEQQARGAITVPGRFAGRLIDGLTAVAGIAGMAWGTAQILQTEALTPTQRTLVTGCHMLGTTGIVLATIYGRRRNE